MTHRLSSTRAFTLLETIVALSIMSVLTTAAISVVVHANRTRAEAVAKAQLVSDANLITQLLGKDLSYLGVGVPRGYRMELADFPSSIESHQLRPPVRVGQTDQLAFVGDLPYPNADLNGVVQIGMVPSASSSLDELYIASELSPCIPQATSPGNYSCNNHQTALVPGPGSTSGSTDGLFPSGDQCKQGQLTRLCPWGMNKWQKGTSTSTVPLILGGIDGSWYERRWDLAQTTTNGSYFGIELNTGRSTSSGFDTSLSSALPTNAVFMAKNSGGFAANIDRVFWSFEQAGSAGSACTNPAAGCVLLRRQCWGQIVDPGAKDFPLVSDTAFRSNKDPSNCTAPADGTGWETVVTGVQSFSLSYFDDLRAAISQPWDMDKSSDVGAIQLDITLQRKIPGGTGLTTFHQKQRFYLENAGGLVDPPTVFPTTATPKSRGTRGHCGHRRCGGKKGRH
jgi:prepilin-type N-terminal cleavage/methylation domain-containing protein